MRGGHMDAVTRTSVSGWAADSLAPDTRLMLRVEVDGREVGRVLAERPRKDLAALGRYGDGAHGFLFNFGGALQAGQEFAISVRFDDGTLLPNGVRLLEGGPLEEAAEPVLSAAASAPAPALAGAVALANPTKAAKGVAPASGFTTSPILVTAPGRSGTTYLMSCLAACPRVTVAELVPYEVRLLSYYAAAFQVLTAPADTERSTHPDRLEGDGFHIGFNPFNGAQYDHAFRGQASLRDFQTEFAPARLGQAFADTIREYYNRLAADQGKDALFFAEKNNNLHRPTRLFVRRIFGIVREVVIVRDPRDVLCSHMAYFSSSQEKAFHQLSHSNRQLAALAEESGADLCVIRYEDMISGDVATYRRLQDFLGVALMPVQGAAGERMFAQHGTSASPAASIGRWRTDLPAGVRVQCHEHWAPFLARFGYETD